ncbi:cyclodeaminase/cyclohydrolase family protein [Vreelandella malpeensis]|uniref:Cyclodeaminase/cyclohydrolase family protein n=1 Tax=Vreelandella malpeensis TaxID=1172368 RepID=A0ABS8DQU1_9GAMM|nr:cyclodeaminase/cyclohydrolase family protein [Halomonas malpeensis]MCB8888245.1 cyclodeaminase/cyclohydrolase family protein [Halomonas malpeensis]
MTQQADQPGIWQTPLDTFRDALAHDPMPGCGAAATVTAGCGLALMLKGLHLGQRHAPRAPRAALIERGEALEQALVPLADADVAAFQAMMAALDRPQQTDEQRASRAEALHRAARDAVEVPLATARRCLEALALGEEILANIETQFESDARAGGYLLSAAVDSVLLNVEANLAALDEQDRRYALKERDTLAIELGAARAALGV